MLNEHFERRYEIGCIHLERVACQEYISDSDNDFVREPLLRDSTSLNGPTTGLKLHHGNRAAPKKSPCKAAHQDGAPRRHTKISHQGGTSNRHIKSAVPVYHQIVI